MYGVPISRVMFINYGLRLKIKRVQIPIWSLELFWLYRSQFTILRSALDVIKHAEAARNNTAAN